MAVPGYRRGLGLSFSPSECTGVADPNRFCRRNGPARRLASISEAAPAASHQPVIAATWLPAPIHIPACSSKEGGMQQPAAATAE